MEGDNHQEPKGLSDKPTGNGGVKLGEGLKFGFTKTTKAQTPLPIGKADEGEAISDFPTHPQEKKETALVIPLIEGNWRERDPPPQSDGQTTIKTEDEMAAQAILEDLNKKEVKEEDTMAIPLLMRNRVPGYEQARGDGELFKMDVAMRPESTSLEDYDRVSVDMFGSALLRGMGWVEGQPIGGTNKGLAEPIEYIPRFGRAGLGAGPSQVMDPPHKKKFIKPGESRERRKQMMVAPGEDGRVKHFRTLSEKLVEKKALEMKVGAAVRVVEGPHKGLYGRVTALQADDHCTVRLAIGGQVFGTPQSMISLVDDLEYQKNHRNLNEPIADRPTKKAKYDDDRRYDSKEARSRYDRDRERGREGNRDRERGREGDRDRERGKEREGGRERERERGREREGEGNRERGRRSWLRSGLRVRIISKTYGQGSHYNRKVIVIDVTTPTTCICRDDNGRLLEDVRLDILETIVPKTPEGRVMIVKGPLAGQEGKVLDRDSHRQTATIQLIMDQSAHRISYDDMCEYVGPSAHME